MSWTPDVMYNSPFHGQFFSFALQCKTWMRGNFGLKLQNSPQLPHVHARLYCDGMQMRKVNRA